MRLSLLVLLTLLTTTALSGDLATLHGVLSIEVTENEADCQSAAPAGAAFAPGIDPCKQATAVVPEPTIDEIGIERSRCLTGCPAYTFTVRADGSFRFVGEAGVERLGSHTGMIERGRLNQVLRFAEAISVMDFEDTYTSRFLDNPTNYTLVEREGVTKVIANQGNSGPPTLWALEQLIDSLLDTAVWD